MPETTSALDHLLAPVSRGNFFAEFWGRAHLRISRGDPSYYSDLFSYRDVDAFLRLTRHHGNEVLTLVPSADSGWPQSRHRLANVPTEHLYRRFQAGDTLRIFDVQHTWPPVTAMAEALSCETCFRVDVNLYLTPSESQGFPVHTDNEEVFIVQVDGAKEWFVYDPVYELPVESYTTVQHQGQPLPPPLPEDQLHLRERLVLEKGDLLYVPRGFPHKARATDKASLHLTIGVHPVYWVDLIKAAVEVVATGHVGLRASLPPGFLERSHDELATTFDGLVGNFTELADVAGAFHALAKTESARFSFPPDGHFATLAEPPELDTGTPVARREGLRCVVEGVNGIAVIHFGGHNLRGHNVRGPSKILPALEHVRDHVSFRVGDLPRLDPQSQVVLVGRLIREGLLRTDLEVRA